MTSVIKLGTFGGACVQMMSQPDRVSSFLKKFSSVISPLAFIGVGTPPPEKPK